MVRAVLLKETLILAYEAVRMKRGGPFYQARFTDHTFSVEPTQRRLDLPIHVTARLAWHNDGWNGAVCKAPEENTYCVGWKSFPGDVIARERDLAVERCKAGCAGKELEGYIPPCSYSFNAFGTESAQAASEPPGFFYGGATRREWTLPPASVCVWPYEASYAEEVKANGRFDNSRRRELAVGVLRADQEGLRQQPDLLLRELLESAV